MLELILVAAALAAGVTGAWSPCGLSMVETLAPEGYAGSLRASVAGSVTFALGAVVGGVMTFGGLSWLGQLLGGGSTQAVLVAAVLASLAAVGEARGMRIVPQVRRQVPESWRRVLPVPLAAGLYGVLLGLGFTTFILSFAVWALAGVSVALGDPSIGLLIGLAFGVGRALPVIVLAPASETDRGAAIHAAMAERPAIYRGLRAVDAVAMAACALFLFANPAKADAAQLAAREATNPTVSGSAFAWQQPRASGILRYGGTNTTLPGRDPVLSGGELAWRQGDTITFSSPGNLSSIGSEQAPGVTSFGFSAQWLVWVARREDGGRTLLARPRGSTQPPAVLASYSAATQIGRPVVSGQQLTYHVAGRSRSRIVLRDLATGAASIVRSERGALLLNPTLAGNELLYVRSTYKRQELRLHSGGFERVVYGTTPTARRDTGREPGTAPHKHYRWNGSRWVAIAPPRLHARPAAGVTRTLWTTALDFKWAYVTRVTLRDGQTRTDILRIRL